jgi:hypothetical protein
MDHEKHISQCVRRFKFTQPQAIGVRLFNRVNQSVDACRRKSVHAVTCSQITGLLLL